MGNFFPEDALEYQRKTDTYGLKSIIEQFPVKLKKALYAAAKTGHVKSGTWNGCAFNKAGKQVGISISSSNRAAGVFNIQEDLVTQFIRRWDSINLGSAKRADLLMRVLENIGITTPLDNAKPNHPIDNLSPIVFNYEVYKSSQTKFIEELETVKTIEDLGISQEEIDEASLLFITDTRLTGDSMDLSMQSS